MAGLPTAMYESLPYRGVNHRELQMSPNLHFKRHKTLPHPTHDRIKNQVLPHVQTHDLSTDHQRPGSSGSQSNSPRTLKHKTQRIGSGPNLPPTPPTHSRTSSSTQSVRLEESIPLGVDNDGVRTPTGGHDETPATPTDQRSPPTPDFTPPQPKPRRAVPRPTLGDRGATRSTTGGSRTESFITAREDPFSSDDEDGGIAIRSSASRQTSRSTIRPAVDVDAYSQVPKPQAITSALEKLNGPVNGPQTLQTPEHVHTLDSGWTARPEEKRNSEEVHKLISTKRKPLPRPARMQSVYELEEKEAVAPAKANTTARKVPHRGPTVESSPSKSTSSRSAVSSRLSHSETSASSKPQSSSTRSVRSTTSAIVEAVLVSSPPQRRRTLRHVRKQAMLRGSHDYTAVSTLRRQSSPSNSGTRVSPKPAQKQSPRDSYNSDARRNSINSTRSRDEVIKNGGIPVLVVPDRRSSSKPRSGRTPSLRSTSSRRSSNKQSPSLHSSTFGDQNSQVSAPLFERTSPRRRPRSMSSSADTMMDQAPVVPRRSSSLSAPTSRNVSRSGSLTAESLRAHNAIHNVAANGTRTSTDYITQDVLPDSSAMQKESVQAEYGLHPLLPIETKKSAYLSSPDLEHHEDGLSSQRGHTRNTPFSVSSLATTGTAPELAEATAVPMYQHQGSSILMVDHAAKSWEETPGAQDGHIESAVPKQEEPEAPTTPPQPTFQLEDVDSPLRNPRAPPEPPSRPPTFNFIPATPSGLTPAADKAAQTGNYFEVAGGKGARRPSLMQRAMSKRRHSISYPPLSAKSPGFLSRTLSLTRKSERPRAVSETAYPEMPRQENRLHPFWRPAGADDDECDSDCECQYEGGRHDDGYYRYPSNDNRPSGPRRTLTQRMKRTFAIMPLDRDDYYYEQQLHGPERRTIGRTPSGNLRVVRQRSNPDSLTDAPRGATEQGGSTRPKTAPENQPKRSFWRGSTVRRRTSRGNLRRRWSLSSGLGEIQNLPQRISEMRRERRMSELRQKISGPTDVQDGVGDVIRSSTSRKRRSVGPY